MLKNKQKSVQGLRFLRCVTFMGSQNQLWAPQGHLFKKERLQFPECASWLPGATIKRRLTEAEVWGKTDLLLPAMGVDYYAVLQVTRNSEDAQIKKA